MKRRSVYLALTLISTQSLLGAQAPATPEVKAFAVYQLPATTRVTLPNGLVILLLEKHDLPMTSVSIGLRSGSLLDPAGKPGVSGFVAGQLRKGTATRTGEKISNDLDFIGMEFDTVPGLQSTDITGDFLSKDTDQALGLMADMVLHPVFPADELKKAVARRQEALKTDKDSAGMAVSRYFMATLYAGHPYARSLSETDASLGSITREDLLAYHRLVYTPANAVIAVVGDFNSAVMEERLKTLFGDWKGAAPAAVSVPAQSPVVGRHVLLVDKPDATQTYFIVGNVGLSETDPDRAPVEVVNTLFGGRFTSLFNEELRIKSGYSYGANSGFQLMRTPGPFQMFTYTKNASTEPAIDKTFEVIEKLHTHPFTDADLLSAKNYIRGTFPPQLETSPALANRFVSNEIEGISRETFNAELAQEQATTLADANRVIDKDFLTKDNYVLVIVGKASEIGKLAAKYGTVTRRSIVDPGY
jgi:predicted Zn-dependent peptidase